MFEEKDEEFDFASNTLRTKFIKEAREALNKEKYVEKDYSKLKELFD